jgi:hypothetical protein
MDDGHIAETGEREPTARIESNEDMEWARATIDEIIGAMIPLASRKRYSSQRLQSTYRDVTKPLRIKTAAKDPRAFQPNKRVTYGQLFGFGDRAHQYLPRAKRSPDDGRPQTPANRIQDRHLLIIRAVLEELNIFPGDPPEFGEQPVSWKEFLNYALAAVKEEPIPKPAEPTPPAGAQAKDASPAPPAKTQLCESDKRLDNEVTADKAGPPPHQGTAQRASAPVERLSLLITSNQHKGNTVAPSARRFLLKMMYVIAGAAVGLLGQGIIVAANYWLTGMPIESVVGLSGAHTLPIVGAVVGAIGGIVLLTSRAQRSNNPVLPQL